MGLGRLPLLEPDEGRNAEVAREMLVSGDWITPRFNALPYLDKPAVFFWLVAGSFRFLGVSEWSARLPSAFAALGTLLLVWSLARRMFGDPTGLRAGIIFATSPLVMIFSRLVIFDMTLTLLVTIAMVSFWVADSSGFKRPWVELSLFGAMGLATITKGPVGFLLPLISIMVYTAARGRFRELGRLRWGLGFGAFLLAALPWFLAASIRNPDFPRYALFQESLQRFFTGQARRSGTIFYYLPVFLGGLFPWSFFLIFAAWHRLKRWRELQQDSQKPVGFLLVWAAVVFVFFTVSQSKLPGYVLPAAVPLSILMARVWAEMGSPTDPQPTDTPDWLTAGFASLVGIGILIAVASSQIFRFAALRARAAARINPAVLPLLTPTLLYTGMILAGLGILGRNVASRARKRSLATVSLALVAILAPALALRWRVPIETYAATSSGRELARTILASPEKDLAVYGYYYFRTGLPFYLRRPVGLVTADADELTSNYTAMRFSQARRAAAPNAQRAAGFREWNGLLVDPAGLLARARSPSGPVLVLVRNNLVGKLTQAVEPAATLEPLWTEWQDSVWKVERKRKRAAANSQ